MRPITNSLRNSNVARNLYDVHFDLTSHFQRQLAKEPIFSPEHSKFFTSSVLHALGESPFMRQYSDRPSQILNTSIKEGILKPVSNTSLSVREHASRDVIETSLELERKRRRFPLRELSTYNVFNSKQGRENLVESHCVGIVKESNNILGANLRNLLTKNGKGQEEKDAVMEMLHVKEDAGKNSISQLILSEKNLQQVKGFLAKEGINSESSDATFNIYETINAEAKNKRASFQEKIEQVQKLEDESGIDRLKEEFAKVRLLYAVEWLARVQLINVPFSAFQEFMTSEEVAAVHEDAFARNASQSASELQKTLGKQVVTTALGASINESSRKKDGTKGRYMIACDTEFHDYLKFFPRVALTFMAGMAAHAMSDSLENEENVAESLTRDFVKMAARFLSGSHIAMRMLPEDAAKVIQKIYNNVMDDKNVEVVLKDEVEDKIEHQIEHKSPATLLTLEQIKALIMEGFEEKESKRDTVPVMEEEPAIEVKTETAKEEPDTLSTKAETSIVDEEKSSKEDDSFPRKPVETKPETASTSSNAKSEISKQEQIKKGLMLKELQEVTQLKEKKGVMLEELKEKSAKQTEDPVLLKVQALKRDISNELEKHMSDKKEEASHQKVPEKRALIKSESISLEIEELTRYNSDPESVADLNLSPIVNQNTKEDVKQACQQGKDIGIVSLPGFITQEDAIKPPNKSPEVTSSKSLKNNEKQR